MINMNEDHRGGTACFGKASLAIGSTATGISIASLSGAGIYYAINGVMYYKADAATAAVTVHDAQAADTKCIYLVCLDSSGTVSSVKGTEVLSTALAAGTAVLEFPTPVADTCPIGYFTMTTVDVTFTTGTDNLTASGCTAAYADLHRIPAAPLTS